MGITDRCFPANDSVRFIPLRGQSAEWNEVLDNVARDNFIKFVAAEQ
ncbi:hypothetical protein [Vibrio diazotrophicus]|nr:hypothetical protein [Vibrio diazotrophicus]